MRKKVTIINPDGSEYQSKFDKLKKNTLKTMSKLLFLVLAIGLLYLAIISSLLILAIFLFVGSLYFLIMKFKNLK